MPYPISLANKEEWETFFRAQQESGLNVKQWCYEKGITSSAFYYWKKRHSATKAIDRSCFQELLPEGRGITLEYHGFKIGLDNQFDAATLRRCVVVLKESI